MKVSLVISHFGSNPKEITLFLKTKPTWLKAKGETYSPSRIPQRINLWVLELDNELDAEKSILKILKKVKNLKRLKSKFRGIKSGISCVPYLVGDDSTPCISFSVETIKKLAEVNCSLDIDYYVFKQE